MSTDLVLHFWPFEFNGNVRMVLGQGYVMCGEAGRETRDDGGLAAAGQRQGNIDIDGVI